MTDMHRPTIKEITTDLIVYHKMSDDFYCRYYVGHKGKFGHEFLEFEITSDGRLRYANNSNYKNDTMIRKEGWLILTKQPLIYTEAGLRKFFLLFSHSVVKLSPLVIEEIKRIISESEITKEDDRNWPEPDKIGRQELEIKINKEHISFTVSKHFY